MKLQKQLLKFFMEKTKLRRDQDEVKLRTLAFKKLKNSDEISPDQLQAKAEEYSAIKKLEKNIKKGQYRVMKQNTELMSILKGVGLPRLKKISFQYENYGTIQFWYKEDYAIYFEQTL